MLTRNYGSAFTGSLYGQTGQRVADSTVYWQGLPFLSDSIRPLDVLITLRSTAHAISLR